MGNTKESQVRQKTRRRLRTMETFGLILDWDFVPEEDIFFITLINGLEIECSSEAIILFQIGAASKVIQTTGKGIEELEKALHGVKRVSLDEEFD